MKIKERERENTVYHRVIDSVASEEDERKKTGTMEKQQQQKRWGKKIQIKNNTNLEIHQNAT